MEISIRKLSPDLAQDYVRFFDETPHDQNVPEHKCYCVCWISANSDDYDCSTAEKRRIAAVKLISKGHLQGYLAYEGNRIVGWCNANAKSNCTRCVSWRYFMQEIPVDSTMTKAVFCFVIAPDMQRKGIATKLLERVITDAKADGFTHIEAYPNKQFVSAAADFMGPASMYKNLGFTQISKTAEKLIMRKTL
ncbi:MAG: GNAT family N-acetyltransferase [Clostridia bacterium]|nr:GNAT family N-acetyltransferase [Clostridia bacterium]